MKFSSTCELIHLKKVWYKTVLYRTSQMTYTKEETFDITDVETMILLQ